MPITVAFAIAHFSLAIAVGVTAGIGSEERFLETVCLVAWMALYALHMAYTRGRGWRPLPLRAKQVLIGAAIVVALVAGIWAQLQRSAPGSPSRMVFSVGIWIALALGAFSVSRLLRPESEPARSPRGV